MYAVQAPRSFCSLNSDKMVLDFLIKNSDRLLKALFSPLFSPGHELIACVFSLLQEAAAFSKSVYQFGIREMLVHDWHTCDQSW